MALIALGAFLLIISALGHVTRLGRYVSEPPRSWERFDPALAERTPDLPSLYRAAQGRATRPLRDLPPDRRMQLLFDSVADRFTHGDQALYSPFSNWVMWLLGAANRRYRDIQDPDILLRGGHSALCGDVSYVLVRLAGMAGIPSRHVLLNGHIVMEAWYSGGWHSYDPDMEVIVVDGTGMVLDSGSLSRNAASLREAYSGRADAAFVNDIVAIYASTGDNRFKSYPARGGITVAGQRPGRVEQAARYARIVLPIGMVLAGAALAALPRGRRRHRG